MLNREQVRGVYAEAAALPASEVSAFLDRACGEDVELRREVESLLASAAKRPGFLGAPTTPMGPGLDVPGERVGMMLGRYRLVEEIGQGGFGTVYVAEQVDPVRRLVALKIIKLGMDTRAVVARFESERQALALMDHPHIARVFDAGASESGRPYFVMELVKGEPITEYADRAELSIDERVDLFVQVCQAVQHAHTKGVIHRDIKPGNVLVATQDGTPHAKVIDFGIAKATQSRLTERTVFTEFRQLVGTPEYMSPEQAGGASDVDTRSDVYGLGATLYELLTGVPPFEPGRLRQAAYEEMRRIIRETEPERPSTRLSRLSVRGDALTRGRRVPRGFGALVLGDLDWIVMKSLEKDRARRYQTAGALAEDLRRHRTGEPVLAAPPSTAYRLRKFAKRHQKLVLATCAVAGALILGIIGTSVGLVMANAARAASDAHASRAEIEAARATRAEEDAVRDRIAAEYEGYIANIESAYGALRADDSTRLRMRLAACPQERRNWEWRFLSAASDGSVRALTHPRQNVQWARFSHDASRLVTTSGDGKVRLWNPESGVEIAAFQGPEVFWGEVDFSPDDTMIVSAANDGRVWVWDTVARKEVVQFGGHTKRVMHAWFVDGARVLSVSKDGTARVWSSRTGDHSAVLEHDGPITAAAFFRAGPLVATASVKVGVRIWSLDKAEPMRLNGQDG
ncbi:MAG: WD40 repeat domain-containing serine/threonine protein kinase, partial [Phycisphaerales bacterium]